MALDLHFSDDEQTVIRKSLVEFFKRIGNGSANSTELSLFPYVLDVICSQGQPKIRLKTLFGNQSEASS